MKTFILEFDVFGYPASASIVAEDLEQAKSFLRVKLCLYPQITAIEAIRMSDTAQVREVGNPSFLTKGQAGEGKVSLVSLLQEVTAQVSDIQLATPADPLEAKKLLRAVTELETALVPLHRVLAKVVRIAVTRGECEPF